MNAMILKLAFGHEVDHDRAPMVLTRLGNTAAAGAIVALRKTMPTWKPAITACSAPSAPAIRSAARC